nr:unnamed protein product [Callosobruchus analis]
MADLFYNQSQCRR